MGTFMCLKNLEEEISGLRKQLYMAQKKCHNLSHPHMISVSQQLDHKISRFQKYDIKDKKRTSR